MREARRGRATARGRSRPQALPDRVIREPYWSGGLATRFGFAPRRGFAGDDAVEALVAALLGDERQAVLLTYDPGQEAAHRVRLPTGRLHDRRDAGSPPAAQHLDHLGLLRVCAGSSNPIGLALATSRRPPGRRVASQVRLLLGSGIGEVHRDPPFG